MTEKISAKHPTYGGGFVIANNAIYSTALVLKIIKYSNSEELKSKQHILENELKTLETLREQEVYAFSVATKTKSKIDIEVAVNTPLALHNTTTNILSVLGGISSFVSAVFRDDFNIARDSLELVKTHSYKLYIANVRHFDKYLTRG